MRIANIPWNKVDRSKADDLRKFIADYPGNPNKAKAQSMLDALLKDGEQSRLKAELSAQKGKVLDTLDRFNRAFTAGKKDQLKAVWPTVSSNFAAAVGVAMIELSRRQIP